MSSDFPHFNVTVVSLGRLFDGSLRFTMPWFQRAYAWPDEHAARLVADVAKASKGRRNRYFLGHILLAGRGRNLMLSVVDGQQRIVTLTILFALLRDTAPTPEDAARLDRHIQPDNGTPILTPQENVRPFLERMVQAAGGTAVEPEVDLDDLMESEQLILLNRTAMAAVLAKSTRTPAQWRKFADFLLQRCYVVLELAEDDAEAWEMLSIEEDRSIETHTSERAKATVLLAMPREAQEPAAALWDQTQARLGRNGIGRLIRYLRLMVVHERTKRPEISDLLEALRVNKRGLAFMRDDFVPTGERLIALDEGRVGRVEDRARIAQSLALLRAVDHDSWVAPALQWLAYHEASTETPAFFHALDRLTWLLKITGTETDVRDARYSEIIAGIASGKPVTAIRALAVDEALRRDALVCLRGKKVLEKRYSGHLARRLSVVLGDDLTTLDERLTLEHVLPRKGATVAAWRGVFGKPREIADFAFRLGNMALLTPYDNQKAGSFAYDVKRPILQASGLALAREAGRNETWTRATVEARTDALIATLFKAWDLPLD